MGPSWVKNTHTHAHTPCVHFLFVEKGFGLLDLPWIPQSRLEQTLMRKVREHETKEKQSRNNSSAAKQSAAAAAKSLQSCPTLCDPIDGSLAGSSVPGILQARTLDSVAISFSNAWKWKVKVKLLSHVRFFATPWTVAHQAPLSMEFSRQEYQKGLLFPPPVFE